MCVCVSLTHPSRKLLTFVFRCKMCELRHQAHLTKDYTPKGDPSTIIPATYYLENVDDMFKREYKVKA